MIRRHEWVAAGTLLCSVPFVAWSTGASAAADDWAAIIDVSVVPGSASTTALGGASAPDVPEAVILASTADGDIVLLDATGNETARFRSISADAWGIQAIGLFGDRLVLESHGTGELVVVDVTTGAEQRIRPESNHALTMVPGSGEVLIAVDYYGSAEVLLVDLQTLTTFDVAAAAGAGTEAYFSYEGSRGSPDGSVVVVSDGTTGDSYLVSLDDARVFPITGRPIAVSNKRVITTTTDSGVTNVIRSTPDGIERSRVTVPWSRAFAELPDGGVVVVDDDGGVHRVDPDVTTVELIGTVSMRSGEIPHVSTAFDGRRVVVGYGGGVETIGLADATPGRTIAVGDAEPWIRENRAGTTRCTWFEVNRGPVVAADLDSGRLVEVGDGYVAGASLDGCTFVVTEAERDVAIFHEGSVIPLPETSDVLELSGDGSSIIVTGGDGVVRLAPTDDPMGGVVLRVDGVRFAFL